MLASGDMDRRIVLQRSTMVADEYGEPIKTWADFVTNPEVWAKVRPITGTERFQAQQVNPNTDTRFFIRFRSDVVVKDRVAYNSEHYDILGILEIGRQEGLELITALEKP